MGADSAISHATAAIQRFVARHVLLNDSQETRHFQGTKVTIARLYPALRQLIKENESWASFWNKNLTTFVPDVEPLSEADHAGGTIIDEHWQTGSPRLTEQLDLALSEYVYNRMPIRLLALPGMELIERDEVVAHIKDKLSHFDNVLLNRMLEKIHQLAMASEYRVWQSANSDEGDARENPVQSIFDFLFHDYGQYAILSHTWQKDEIRYQNTLEENWQVVHGGRAGFTKIQGFSDIVVQHGITLAWADTICINKDSSAELDESIRSMYQWYKDSSLCITYLHQTSALGPNSDVDDPLPYKDTLWSRIMAKDRWFTRGWTLQELLAPKRMKFYDNKWYPMQYSGDNDKEDPEIQELVTSVTGINEVDLKSFDPMTTKSSIIDRMVWATKRKTTRGEDRAYSLMGIFGVSLSIAYGEGAERAFFRLVKKIITSRDASQIIQVLAWGGKPISDQIHPSRILPSSPECYLYLPYRVKDFDRYLEGDFSPRFIAKTCSVFPKVREPMVLTHLGLRVRMVLLKTNLLAPKNNGTGDSTREIGPFRVTVWCKLRCFGINEHLNSECKTDIDLQRTFSNKIRTNSEICEFGGMDCIFFIGIYTFTEDDKFVYLPPWYCAFFLGIPEDPKFTMAALSPEDFQPSSKIDTQTILQLDNYQRTEVVPISKSGNSEIMKVLTVNL